MPEVAAGLDSSDWRAVDTTGDAHSFVGYLDRVADLLQDARQETLRALELFPGASILDVGSGTGAFLIDAARSVADVRAVGIDSSAALTEAGHSRAEAAGVKIELIVGDAEHLEFPDASFDRINCSRVLQHLEHPDAAVKEMARVLAPGGRMAIWEPDFDAILVDSNDLAISRAVRTHLTAPLRHPDIGRQLRRLILDADLILVELSGAVIPPAAGLQEADGYYQIFAALDAAVAAGDVSSEGAATWRRWLEESDARGHLFIAPVGFFALVAKNG
jgi:SAM-dependent methyltransferase